MTVAGGAPITRPVVTYTLIGLNLAIFGLQFLAGIDAVAGGFGMWPVSIALENAWFRLLTSAFLHGSFLHIAFNMYVLFALGPTLNESWVTSGSRSSIWLRRSEGRSPHTPFRHRRPCR